MIKNNRITNDKKYNTLTIIEEARRKYKSKCEFCGWDNYFIKHEKPITNKTCKKCGNLIFINEKEKFKYKMEMKMGGAKNV